MKRLLLLFALSLLLVAGGIQAQTPEGDKAKLQGTWKLVGMERGGESALDKVKEREPHLVIRGDRLLLQDKERTREMTYQLGADKKLRTIDIIEKGREQTTKGIYQLQGDDLKICTGAPGGERPKDFKTKAGTRDALMIFKRVADKE